MSQTKKRTDTVAIRTGNKDRSGKLPGQDQARERGLDETLAETFPASDPLSTDPDPEVAEDEVRNGKVAS